MLASLLNKIKTPPFSLIIGFSAALLITFSPETQAQIFGGSETEEGIKYGICLGVDDENDPNYETCKDVDCEDPQNREEEIMCTSEAEIGTALAGETLEPTGIASTDNFGDFIKKVVNFVLPYLTLAAFLGYVAAGVLYITAAGNDEQITKAKKILIWSSIGLILVILSFSITRLLTQDLVEGLN